MRHGNQIKLYDTRTKKLRGLKPHKKNIHIYSCGPTLYQQAHIGNMRSYVFADTLNRALRHFGYAPNHVINLTDVGHLTDDADAGEDKVEKQARREQTDAEAITKRIENLFYKDIEKLGIQKKRYQFPRATAHIPEQINLIKKLEEKHLTYNIPDGIYFNTKAYQPYGALGLPATEDENARARIRETSAKKHSQDFALWKRTPEGTKRQQEWDSPWGCGFPGWHIECSAMAMKLLGETIDIHTGGMDHITVHHNNEIAQSEAATGKTFARIWMHNAFLTINEDKLSKSLGNSYTIDDLERENCDPLALRYIFLQASYRTPLHFSFEALTAAQTALNRLQKEYAALPRTFFSRFSRAIPDSYRTRIDDAIADDLNTAKVLAAVWDVLRDSMLSPNKKRNTIRYADRVLGILSEKQPVQKEETIPEEISTLLTRRETARAKKDYNTADAIREEINKLGYEIIDTENKSTARRRKI